MDSQIIALCFSSFLTAPPQVHEPSISSTISLPICEPLSISPTSYRNSPMGPPPFISFHDISASPGAFILHWGTRFCILYIFPCMYFLYKPCYYKPLFSSSPLAACLPFGHTQPMSPLVGALLLIHPHRQRLYLQSMTQVTYRYPLHLFTLSRLWHNLPRILSSP
jgi:hypothetical protein